MTRRQALALAAASPAAASPSADPQRPLATLDNGDARVSVDLLGGSIVDFRLGDASVNPLVWANDAKPGEAKPMSHFLCLDRWGQPSAAELANGMPYHGEATRVEWALDRPPARDGQALEAVMSARMPMAGLRVERTIRLAGQSFRVRETVTNENKLGRIYNLVQHPTIGPPFLDERTLVDANAGRGFMQSSPLPDPETVEIVWPNALKEGGRPVDLRRLTDDPAPNVCSFVIDEERGWVTAASPSSGLLIGYVWETAEYPWLNIWRHTANGEPLARGLEFGTTGLHQPFGALVRKGRIFDRPLLDYLDAGESRERSYTAFLAEIPEDFAGVSAVKEDSDGFEIVERGGGRRVRAAAAGIG